MKSFVTWIAQVARELVDIVRGGLRALTGEPYAADPLAKAWHLATVVISFGLVGFGVAWASRSELPIPPRPYPTPATGTSAPAVVVQPPDLTKPVRAIPDTFPANTRKPSRREGANSISIRHVPFDPLRDLIEIDDHRVWWESDNDHGDTENDHQFHRNMEVPIRRLIELVSAEGGTLEIQDSYRATGVHSPSSLHRQGRAVDLTCDELGLERLAQLTWAAGFDWVYYEAPKRGGHHVHASVRPDAAP